MKLALSQALSSTKLCTKHSGELLYRTHRAMADDSVEVVDDSEFVTVFFLTTCLQQPSEHYVQAALECAKLASQQPTDDTESVNFIPAITGSTAELYIRPMLSCVGDMDIMFHYSSVLAIPSNCPPPTLLPAEFHRRVKVYEIIDSEFPGYVFLKISYVLTDSSNDGRYHAQRAEGHYASYTPRSDGTVQYHGPAQISKRLTIDKYFPVDRVGCVRCLLWPPQAADWPTRHRNYGWPDSATVDRAVSNGCDMVHVAHRLCRQHEWARKHQCRLSFSRAEIILLNTWMPVQQITYHMLRIFSKTEQQLTTGNEGSGRKTLSNYHIKTLMLWAAELEPRNSWITDVNVVRICVKLLHTLSVWLTNARCPHYFMNDCNLIESTINLEIIPCFLLSVTESMISTWFINNRIRHCFHHSPFYVQLFFADVGMSLENVVSAVAEHRLINSTYDLFYLFISATFFVPQSLEMCKPYMTALSCTYLMKELTKIDSRLSVYCTALTFLHVAYKTPMHGFRDELMEVLATILGQNVGRRSYFKQRGSELLLRKATTLMKVIANNTRSTVQLIQIELSKAYLYRALRCKDSESNYIYCLANVYLAVLYYTTGQYQKAIDHCTVVTRSHDQSHCSSHVLQGELLTRTDDNTDNVLGLVVFYHYICINVLKQQQQQQQQQEEEEYKVSVLNTETFAHYLHTRCSLCLSITNCSQFIQTASADETINYITDIQQPLQIADLLLLKTVNDLRKGKHRYKPLTDEHRLHSHTTCTMELNTSELVELLQQSAVKHLSAFRESAAQAFQSIVTIVPTDFVALYAYKRGDYRYCLQLSTQNVGKLLLTGRNHLFSIFPEFIQLLDDDVVSLTALSLIVNPKCRHNGKYTCLDQLILSLYLMAQCQLKLHHSLTQLTETLDYIEVGRRTCMPSRLDIKSFDIEVD